MMLGSLGSLCKQPTTDFVFNVSLKSKQYVVTPTMDRFF